MENTHYVGHINILSPWNSDIRHIGLISPCKSDNCRCAKSLVIFMRSIWGTYKDNCPPYLREGPPYSAGNSWLGSGTYSFKVPTRTIVLKFSICSQSIIGFSERNSFQYYGTKYLLFIGRFTY